MQNFYNVNVAFGPESKYILWKIGLSTYLLRILALNLQDSATFNTGRDKKVTHKCDYDLYGVIENADFCLLYYLILYD